MVLASMGLYGVLAYSTGERTKELGVRIALGATGTGIAKMVVWQGMKPAAVGAVLGLVIGSGATRLLQTMLFEVKPMDPAVTIAVVVVLGVVAAAACLVPAWKAARVDPVEALRAE